MRAETNTLLPRVLLVEKRQPLELSARLCFCFPSGGYPTLPKFAVIRHPHRGAQTTKSSHVRPSVGMTPALTLRLLSGRKHHCRYGEASLSRLRREGLCGYPNRGDPRAGDFAMVRKVGGQKPYLFGRRQLHDDGPQHFGEPRHRSW